MSQTEQTLAEARSFIEQAEARLARLAVAPPARRSQRSDMAMAEHHLQEAKILLTKWLPK